MHPDEVLEWFAELNFKEHDSESQCDMKVVRSMLWMTDELPDLGMESKYLDALRCRTFSPDANKRPKCAHDIAVKLSFLGCLRSAADLVSGFSRCA
mmetsp:Transcript_33021/g.53396  ORF Transcript_33021/g.53396 Transcript_33021/m.53396 type:complete len:96 (-) Transcript_33021:69-356(-)